MNKKLILFVVIPIVSILIIVMGCYFTFLLYNNFQIREAANQSLYPRWECLELSADDLTGTWYAGNPTRNDTLIIREDGTYKQLIHIENDYDFESDWQPWRLEYTNDGNLVHLEGLNLCAAFMNLDDCENTGGKDFNWGNFCRFNPNGESTPANGVGVLIAMQTANTRTNFLRPMYLQELPWIYELESP
jgi:hypothetical protein